MSELRQDLVSGDWIIVAPERFKRPQEILKKKTPRKPSSVKTCPFEDASIRNSPSWPPSVSTPSEKNWRVIVVPNKFPALRHVEGCAVSVMHGPHSIKSGAGAHDLVIPHNHRRELGEVPKKDALELFTLMQKRYRQLAEDPCNVYPSGFFNWGISAGASVYHPHCQILTLPIIPPDVYHSLEGSKRYFHAHKKCVHCVMLAFDRKEQKRVLDQNTAAISFTPYISRTPFEVRVFPKLHLPRFEETPQKVLRDVVSVLQKALARIKKNLHDPDLNFFIHTSPFKGSHGYYHWHIEIQPKISIAGGFELGTGIDINVVDPEAAAHTLRK